MARRSFFSFYYKPDSQRAAQVRSMGMVDGNKPVSDNGWEAITRGGDAAIKKWIAEQMSGTSCTIVLIGTNTAKRKWIDYEIIESWNGGKGVVGVHIHNLKDLDQNQSSKGVNPFAHLTLGQKPLSTIVKVYDPPSSVSTAVYGYIKDNLSDWVEEAIAIRNRY
jgi:hypothetical protein